MFIFFAPQSASLDPWSLRFWVQVLQVIWQLLNGEHFGHLIASWYFSFSLASQCPCSSSTVLCFLWILVSNESDTSFIRWHAFKQSAGSKSGKQRRRNQRIKGSSGSATIINGVWDDSLSTISSYSAFTLSHRTLDLMVLWHLKTNSPKMAGWMTHLLSRLMILESLMNLVSLFDNTTKVSGQSLSTTCVLMHTVPSTSRFGAYNVL